MANGKGQLQRYITLGQFLRRVGISYRVYAKARAEGKTPPELKLSRKTILISEEDILSWRLSSTSAPKQTSLKA